MFSWTPYAFVRIVLFFIAGILAGVYFPSGISISLAWISFALLSFVFMAMAILRSRERMKTFNPGIVGLLAVFFAGYIQVYHSTDYRKKDHILHDSDTIRYYQARVMNQAQEKPNSWKIEVSIQRVQHNNRDWHQRSGKVLLYFSKGAFDTPYQYGDVLLIKGSPRLLTEPANPGEFDYKRFLTFRKIYHQHFLRDGDALLLRHQPSSVIMDYSIRARIKAEEALQRNVTGEREQATASALVLGVTDGLDNDLIGAYAATGSLHVLSVSGLHIGIIYWLILLVLRPLNKTTSGRWILAIVSILVLWGYAFVTGLSPSVLRAVTMFSFVALARPWGQRTNIYNTLAASAFCLLLYEPYLIMSVGFQLSYLAVLGIVYLQPKLSWWWSPKSLLLENIWQITCVSVAAQLATFALGLLYFHQFPVYFLFSNLFVIPASFVVLVVGISVILLNFIPWVAGILGFVLEWTIRILNFGVFKMEALPFSLIDNIHITTFQCWLLMGAILFALFLFHRKKFSGAIAAAICVILFSMAQWYHFKTAVDEQKITIYKVAGHSAWDILSRGHVYFFTDSGLARDFERVRFHIRPNRLQSGVRTIYIGDQQDFTRSFAGCRLVLWKGVKILQIQEREFLFPKGVEVDYLIIGKNAIKDITAISSIKFKKLILDSSNSVFLVEKILKEAKEQPWDVYSVLHQGAFTAKL